MTLRNGLRSQRQPESRIRGLLQLRAASSISISRLAGGLGAEVGGVDLSTLDEETIKSIRQAFLDNQVIFFRDQLLELSAFRDFAAHFGKPIEYPFVKGIDGYPEIIQVLKREHEKNNFGGIWHSDTSYLAEPPMGTVLIAREVPPFGGDTIFASQYLAYESLSDGLKKVLRGLRAVNSSAKADVSKTREDRVKDSAGSGAAQSHEACHPVVRTHPETGRKALYVNTAHTARFEGWTEDESKPLLDFLFQHQVRPEFTCRFRWQAGSIAFWDNRCVQHNPINDYHGQRRLMHRITLKGDQPV